MTAPDDDEQEGADPTAPEGKGADSGDEVGGAPMRAALVSVFGCGLCFSVVGFAVFGARAGVGVLVGGLLATANLWAFARVGQAFVSQKGSAAPWGVVAVLKLLLLFGGVWLILKSGFVSGLSLAAGYGALPFGITFASLFGPKPPESDLPPTHSTRRGRDVVRGPRAGRGAP